jgi:hypothetical protein
MIYVTARVNQISLLAVVCRAYLGKLIGIEFSRVGFDATQKNCNALNLAQWSIISN